MSAAPALGYSSDELRVLTRVTELILPASLEPGWAEEDRPVADVVAARSLIARGALVLDAAAGDPRPTTAVSGLLAPLRDATTVFELTRTDRDGAARREVLAGGRATVTFTEREPDVWESRALPHPVRAAALSRLGELLDEFVAPAGAEQPAAPPAPAWDWPPDSRYRVDDDAAWQEALTGLTARYLVRFAHRRAAERWELAEARWIDTGRHGLWWCAVPPADADDGDRPWAEPATAQRIWSQLGVLLDAEEDR